MGKWRDVDLDVIGPQRADEAVLSRRVRFHQSWYRAAVLGLDGFGMTSGKSPRALGSILTDADALAGRNFTSEASARLYGKRRAAGWGVDPVRCTKYLTSSQALTLNLLGPLEDSPSWAVPVLDRLLGRDDIEGIVKVWVEFAPRRRSEYLHDMTRIDALLQLRTSRGDELLAIETKYADRFNSRRVDIDRAPYRDLAARLPLWVDTDAVLAAGHLNQLARCHALAAAMTGNLTGLLAVPSLLVLHHRDDWPSRLLVDEYAAHVADPTVVRAHPLDAFIEALALSAETPAQRRTARALEIRYAAEAESEPAWRSSGDRSLRTKR